jgi:hypothetical protein
VRIIVSIGERGKEAEKRQKKKKKKTFGPRMSTTAQLARVGGKRKRVGTVTTI